MDSMSFLVNPIPFLASRRARMFPFWNAIMVGTACMLNLSQSGFSSSFTSAAFFWMLFELISSNYKPEDNPY